MRVLTLIPDQLINTNSRALNCPSEMSDSHQMFLETADFLGAKLCREAIWSGNRCNWTGPSLIKSRNGRCTVANAACNADLFSGTTGIAIFLARLFSVTRERVFRLTAEAAVRQALSRLDDIPPNVRIGFYKGLSGVAYALSDLSELLEIPKFGPMALLLLKEVEKDQQTAQEADVVSGRAGAITALLEIHNKLSEDYPLELAIKQGELLLERRVESGGFAEGAHGISWALSELYRATGFDHFRQAADHFAPLLENAALQRNERGKTAWFDGASGIGMALLRKYELLRDSTILDQAKSEVEEVAERLSRISCELGFTDYSLAHGVTGEAELLLDARRVLGDESYAQLAERIGHVGIECFRKDDLAWPCGGEDKTESPDLMNGICGIGHFYLRLCDPQQTSSLLMLRPAHPIN